MPPSLVERFFPFQLEGVKFGATHHGRILIGDEMGVGKTVQALAISYLYREDWPLLILSPSSLKLLWRDEILKWFPSIPKDEIEVINTSKRAFTSKSQIYILSFDMAKNVEEVLKTHKFRIAIADEAHYLKSRDAKRTKILSPLLMKCKRVLLLTGTPMLGRPMELYNLVHILRPDLFPSFREFGFRYCDPRVSYFGTDWGNSSNVDELHLILSNTVMIRRLKAQVLNELPSKRRQKIQVETETRLLRSVQRILQKCTEKEINHILEQPTDELNETHKNIMVAYKLSGLSKIKGICEFLNILIDNQLKFIVFAHHMELLSELENFIKQRKNSYIRIDGSVPPAKRHQLVNKYQTEDKCKVALLSLTASSQGITLTASSTVVFAEMNWTPGIMEQAEDRVHRIGQKNAVTIYYLYAEDTLDPFIYKMIKTKNELVAQALNGEKSKFLMPSGSLQEAKDVIEGKEEIKEYVGNKRKAVKKSKKRLMKKKKLNSNNIKDRPSKRAKKIRRKRIDRNDNNPNGSNNSIEEDSNNQENSNSEYVNSEIEIDNQDHNKHDYISVSSGGDLAEGEE